MKRILTTTTLGIIFLCSNSFAAVNSGNENVDRDVEYLQTKWAEINYSSVDENAKETDMKKLSGEAEKISAKYPNFAEPKIWQAIIVSTQAGIKGGLGALGLVKKSKALLEESQQINATALNGSAYTSLGSLYYKVPGWPIGFGDNDKAKENLQTALKINPDGIDPNYFYADYLFQQDDYQGAYTYLQKAFNAKAREGRELADKGRKEEIKSLLMKVESKLK